VGNAERPVLYSVLIRRLADACRRVERLIEAPAQIEPPLVAEMVALVDGVTPRLVAPGVGRLKGRNNETQEADVTTSTASMTPTGGDGAAAGATRALNQDEVIHVTPDLLNAVLARDNLWQAWKRVKANCWTISTRHWKGGAIALPATRTIGSSWSDASGPGNL